MAIVAVYRVNANGTIQQVVGEVQVPTVVIGTNYYVANPESTLLSNLTSSILTAVNHSQGASIDLPKLDPNINGVVTVVAAANDITVLNCIEY
jgi:hypothetical protein